MKWNPLPAKPFNANDWNRQLESLFAEVNTELPANVEFEDKTEITIATPETRLRSVEIWFLSPDGNYYREDHLIAVIRQKPGEVYIELATPSKGKVVIT